MFITKLTSLVRKTVICSWLRKSYYYFRSLYSEILFWKQICSNFQKKLETLQKWVQICCDAIFEGFRLFLKILLTDFINDILLLRLIALNHSLEWNKDFWSCWITPCDDTCIHGWLDSGASQSNLHGLSLHSASRWRLNTSVDSAETVLSLRLFQRFTIRFEKKLHLAPVLAWSLHICFGCPRVMWEGSISRSSFSWLVERSLCAWIISPRFRL